MRLRILADDLTGALDSAAAFAGEIPVALDTPGSGDEAVSVVATATRDVAALDLPRLLAPSLGWLRDAGLAFKKVDSLLRGNTFAECAWLARQGGFTRIVFAPAFPAQGRITQGGRAWIAPAGSAPPQAIGEPAIAEAFSGLGAPEVWVPDVSSDDDLRRIAALSLHPAARDWLWCGSAGLALAFARVHRVEARADALAPAASPLLLVSASHHPVVRRQWAHLLPEVTGGLELHDLAPVERLSSAQAATLLARQAAALAGRTTKPASLIVIGGDTLRALCHATGARSLLARASPRAGWGRARWVGGRWDGVDCHSRSGAFGADDDLLSMVRVLAPRA